MIFKSYIIRGKLEILTKLADFVIKNHGHINEHTLLVWANEQKSEITKELGISIEKLVGTKDGIKK